MRVYPDLAEASNGDRASLSWFALPIVAILTSYAVVMTGGFVWDDYDLIINSSLITGKGSLADHFSQPFWSNVLLDARSFYRPLVTLSYALDYRLWGAWAGGFHLTNLCLHLVCALLLVALCRRAGASPPVACILAAAFAIFPRLSQCVAWISGRTDPAATIGVLTALLLYKPGRGAWARRSLAGFSLFLALLCKEVAVAGMVALILFAWHQAAKPKSIRRIAFELLPVGLAVAVYTAMRLLVMSGTHLETEPAQREPMAVLAVAVESVTRYAWMLFDPLRPRLQIGNRDHPQLLLSAIGVLLLVSASIALWRWRARISSHVWLAIGLGGTAIALVAHVLRLDINSIAADRFLYLPVVALAIGLASIVEHGWQRHRPWILLASAILLGSFAIATSLQARTWANEMSLWREAVAQSEPGMPLPRVELAVALMHRGRYQEALNYLDQVSAEHRSITMINRASCLDKLGQRALAIELLESLVRREPGRSRAHINLMLLHARDLRFDKAQAIGSQLAAKLGDRLDILALIKRVNLTAFEWKALPAESVDEPVTLQAQRAVLFERLGALPEAQERWRSIVLDPRADREMRVKGTAFLSLFGNAEVAQYVLDRVSSNSDIAGQLPMLRAALEARFDDGESK